MKITKPATRQNKLPDCMQELEKKRFHHSVLFSPYVAPQKSKKECLFIDLKEKKAVFSTVNLEIKIRLSTFLAGMLSNLSAPGRQIKKFYFCIHMHI
ncbi:hypothetical protein CEXT_406341 [Caerostris extrusa]|uniref:Uncharacterized protein n=1 Tax=Caerostris extrusa TaxID=172846 RepID=A0AAV4QS95_CAEEX|nr:hypothetical protein CEXT_406341 [Caerostris extrusa]